MLFEKLETYTVNTMIDKFAIKELIEFERFCRDNALWRQMHECYLKDSYVTVSWYQGDGHGFVEKSSKMKTVAPHRIFNTLVWINENRALAVTMACIQSRTLLEGKELDLSSYVKLVYTLVKEESRWKIASLEAVYEKDCLVPASPDGLTPNPNFRSSYANLINVIGSEGYIIDQELPGDDRTDLRDALLAKVEKWLRNS